MLVQHISLRTIDIAYERVYIIFYKIKLYKIQNLHCTKLYEENREGSLWQ